MSTKGGIGGEWTAAYEALKVSMGVMTEKAARRGGGQRPGGGDDLNVEGETLEQLEALGYVE